MNPAAADPAAADPDGPPAGIARAGLDDEADPGEGTRVELTVGAVAHGGHCVARIGGDGGRVVFVRHALPGERVIAEITELRRGYLRADAVEIRQASPDRVEPPCPWSRPIGVRRVGPAGALVGGCGGCDLQHVTPDAQRDWKAAVVCEQLTRLGGLTEEQVRALEVRVRALSGGQGELGWRTRIRYAVDAAGRAGLHRHRSHEVVPIDWCRIAHPGVRQAPVLDRRWSADTVEVVASATGDLSVRADNGTVRADGGTVRADGGTVREQAVGRTWNLDSRVFWQVHPAAADTLAEAVLDLLAPTPGETAWDLYGGAGLFGAALADRVGTTGAVTVVESGRLAAEAARANLTDLPQVRVIAADVAAALRRGRIRGPVDLVVLDPPRSGAGAEVVRKLAGCGARAVAYVACDPAALARDIRTFAGHGWRVAQLRGYDCFPMTHHVECVALLVHD